jgi:hypothetical protein
VDLRRNKASHSTTGGLREAYSAIRPRINLSYAGILVTVPGMIGRRRVSVPWSGLKPFATSFGVLSRLMEGARRAERPRNSLSALPAEVE